MTTKLMMAMLMMLLVMTKLMMMPMMTKLNKPSPPWWKAGGPTCRNDHNEIPGAPSLRHNVKVSPNCQCCKKLNLHFLIKCNCIPKMHMTFCGVLCVVDFDFIWDIWLCDFRMGDPGERLKSSMERWNISVLLHSSMWSHLNVNIPNCKKSTMSKILKRCMLLLDCLHLLHD